MSHLNDICNEEKKGILKEIKKKADMLAQLCFEAGVDEIEIDVKSGYRNITVFERDINGKLVDSISSTFIFDAYKPFESDWHDNLGEEDE